MKKLLFVIAICIAVAEAVYCANQPTNIGYAYTDSPFSVGAKTKAQLNALTPDTTGEFLYCSDCTTMIVCVSSGSHPTTSIGAWVTVSSAAALSSLTHCQ